MNFDELAKQLAIDEGKRSKPYKDTVGKVTIGIGRNLDDVGLSEDEILYLLKNDINRVCVDLDKWLPWWRNLSDRRQAVIANMCFNMGIGSLLSFKNTLQAMREGRYEDAAGGMVASKWAQQVGNRAQRLANMMKEG